MAQTFHEKNVGLHLSDEEIEFLLAALIKIGRDKVTSGLGQSVLDYMEKQLESDPANRANSFTPIPEPINSDAQIQYLASLCSELAILLAGHPPSWITQELRRRETQLRWLAIALDCYQLINSALNKDQRLGEFSLQFNNPKEEKWVELERLGNQLTHLHKKFPTKIEPRLTLLDKKIEILTSESLSIEHLIITLEEKVDDLLELDRVDQAIDTLKEIHNLEPDADEKQAIAEIIEDLKQQRRIDD